MDKMPVGEMVPKQYDAAEGFIACLIEPFIRAKIIGIRTCGNLVCPEVQVYQEIL